MLTGMDRPTIFQAAGGAEAFLALARDFHERCLADPELEHPFSHTKNLEHVRFLADYWGEVFGGPPLYTERHGGHTAMLAVHANQGAHPTLGAAFVRCFVEAADGAQLPDDPELRAALRSYMEWATAEVLGYSPAGAVVPHGLPMPRWDWSGLRA
jgi:hemoglobin